MVSAFHDTEYVVRYKVREGVVCPECESGEVYQPMQAMDMPMLLECLRCGFITDSGAFRL